MLNNKDPQPNASSLPNLPGSMGRTISYLGPGLRIKGEIAGNEDLKLDCNVEGLVSIGGFRITVGNGAQVTGDIVAREALISGKVSGDIRAVDRIEILKSASIEGDLTTGKITIEEGAYFKGSVEVGSDTSRIGTDLDSLLTGAKKSEKR